jgi:hypothetical protein
MATTIHLPHDVLLAVDKAAATLKMSRSGYITMVLARQQSATESTAWSFGFIESFMSARDERPKLEEWFKR